MDATERAARAASRKLARHYATRRTTQDGTVYDSTRRLSRGEANKAVREAWTDDYQVIDLDTGEVV